MRLARQQRRCAEEISPINVVEDVVIDAVSGLRDFNAALAYQIKRIAWFSFAKNDFARFLSQHANFWRDAFDGLGVNSFKQAIIIESLDGSGPGSGFHSIQNQLAIEEPSGKAPSILAYFRLSRTLRT